MNRAKGLECELATLEVEYSRRMSRTELGLAAIVLCGQWAVIGGLAVFAAMIWSALSAITCA
jgi:hypothetical protein